MALARFPTEGGRISRLALTTKGAGGTVANQAFFGRDQALAGVSAGTSTSSGTLSTVALIALDGTSAGTSTSSGSLDNAVSLGGTSTGTSTSSATIGGLVFLEGTSTGTSTSSGAIGNLVVLQGTSAGTSNDTGALKLSVALSGTSVSTSATTGDLSVPLTLSGVSAGGSTSSGNLGAPYGYSAAVMADSPVGYWRLGDASGTVAVAEVGADGAYVNAPTLGVPGLVIGDSDTAVRLAKINSQKVTASAQIIAGGVGDGTIELIFNWSDTPGTNNWLISDSQYFGWGIYHDGNYLRAKVLGYSDLNPAVLLPMSDVWGVKHQIAITKIADVFTLYLDGNAIGSLNSTGTIGPVMPWNLGAFGGGSSYSDVIVDEFAIYDHGLTAARIAAHSAASGVEVAVISTALEESPYFSLPNPPGGQAQRLAKADGDPAPYIITGNIEKVTVSLYATHEYISDLVFKLTSPFGTEVNFIYGAGNGPGDSFGTSPSDINRTVLDDQAAVGIYSGTSPFVGSFIPSEPLGGFIGEASAGTWTMQVYDRYAVDVGTLQAASVFITASGVTTRYNIAGLPAAIPDNDPVGISMSFQVADPNAFTPVFDRKTGWTLYVAYSTQINEATGSRPPTVAELVYARDISMDFVLNRPGAVRFSMQLDDPRANFLVPLQSCIVAVRDGVVRWTGPVWTVDQDIANGKVQVGAVGWLDLLDHRQLRSALFRPAENEDQRMDAIFAAMALQTDTLGNFIKMPLTYGGCIGTPSARPPAPYVVGNKIGSMVNELIEVESGFDIRVSPTTRVLTIHKSPVYKGILGYGVVRPNALFAYGLGPDNLQGITQQYDASTMANIVNAIGPSGIVPQQTDDPDSIITYGAFEEDFSMTGASATLATLRLGAAAEVYFRKSPRVTWQAVPFPWTKGGNVPRFLEDYEIGDVVSLAGKRSWLSIPGTISSGGTQLVRIYGVSISIDENGDERISSLQLAPG